MKSFGQKNTAKILIVWLLVFVVSCTFGALSLEAYGLPNADKRDGYSLSDMRNLISNFTVSADGATEDKNQNDILELTAPQFNVRTLAKSKKPDEQSLVVTIMGDGFIETEQNIFIEAATEVSEYLLGFYPFSLFADVFSIYAIEVISNESGVSRDYNNWVQARLHVVDNYFGSRFWSDNATERALNVTNYGRVNELMQPNTSMSLVIANSLRYGGTGGYTATVSRHSAFLNVTTHEFGHSFGGLIDEYWYEGETINSSEGPNSTRESDPTKVRWRQWINSDGTSFEGIGIYKFAETGNGSTWYRPHQTCHMRSNGAGFCAVCATELVKKMAAKVSEPFFVNSKITDSSLPKGANKILPYTYSGCYDLETVTIPSTVEIIGNYAFLRTTALHTITNNSAKPQIINDTTFAGVTRENIKIIVPIGSVKAYINAGWTGFDLVEGSFTTESIIATLVAIFVIFACFAYIIKEMQRRKKQSKNTEININIKLSQIVFAIITVLIFGCTATYFLKVVPGFLSSLFIIILSACLVFYIACYGLARKRIVATNDKVLIYYLFFKKKIPMQVITEIKSFDKSVKVFAKNKKLFSIKTKKPNKEQFLDFIKEKSNCQKE